MHISSGEVNLQLSSFDIPTHFLGFRESVYIFFFLNFVLFVSAHFFHFQMVSSFAHLG
jgi:hypothetical protein